MTAVTSGSHADVPAGQIHVPYQWSYADTAAREAATGFVPGDVGKLARQVDDNSLWMLTDDDPETWVQVGGGSGGAPTDYPYAGFGTHGDLSAEVNLLGYQLVNEIKGWPPVVAPDADLVTLNLWWDDVATPSTKATVVDVAGEAGITETYELALKCVGDGAGDGLMQRFTFADEPRLKSGRVASALLAIWSVSAVEVTAKLVNQTAEETAAAAVTTAAWTLVEIPAHTLAGTYVDLQVTAGAAGTFYVVPLGLCVGTRGLALPPRRERWVDVLTDNVVNDVDPGGATFADLDLTAATSPLATAVQLAGFYLNTAAGGIAVYARRNGSAAGTGVSTILCLNVSGSIYGVGTKRVACDDGQVIEWQTGGTAGQTEHVYLGVSGFWEWA
jgi:hypothetical protein